MADDCRGILMSINRVGRSFVSSIVVMCLTGMVGFLPTISTAQTVEWSSYGADDEGSKYSPLDQINGDNFGDLEIVWRRSVLPDVVRGDRDIRASLAAQNTPLMVDGRLYISTGLGTCLLYTSPSPRD